MTSLHAYNSVCPLTSPPLTSPHLSPARSHNNNFPSSGLQPRLVVRTVAPAVSSQGTILQRLPGSQTVSGGGQVIRPGGMVMSGGQRLINPGGQVILAAPGQQLVRTSSGQILQLPQTGARPGGTVVRGPTGGGAGAGAAALQRVVINQPGMRPGQPGSQITVPLSTLQSLQAGQGIPTGTPGHLLVKTESGQYQILRVGQQNTVRLPTQPVARPPPPVQPPVNTNTTVGAGAVVSPSPSAGASAGASASVTASANAGGGMGQQMTPDTAKIKCKNFLATLLRLASDQPDTVATNVRSLIQGLIEGRVEPEVFTTKLQRELNSSPQPCLVPFLRKSLPYLQHSLATRELTIEGVTPPNLSQVGKLPPATSLSGGPSPAPPPVVRGTTVMRPAVARPTLIRPGSASMPQLPTRPLPVQIKTAATHLMPPPGVINPVQRDKKTGGAYSAAGDDDINDVAAMGGVNLAEEANVSCISWLRLSALTVLFSSEDTGRHRPCRVHHQICQGRVFPANWSPQSEGCQDLQGKGRTETTGLVESRWFIMSSSSGPRVSVCRGFKSHLARHSGEAEEPRV